MNIECYGSGSSGNCYRITNKQGNSILLDAGVKVDELRRKGFSFRNLKGAFVTHSHQDHCKSVGKLLHHGTSIYLSAETRKEMHLTPSYLVSEFNPNDKVLLGGFTIKAFSLEHDVPNVGYLIKSDDELLVYITDTYYCRYKFPGVTHLMIEVNHSWETLDKALKEGRIHKKHYERLKRSHFALENVVNFLKANDLSKLKEIRILHLSDDNGNAELFKETLQRLTGVYVKVEGGDY